MHEFCISSNAISGNRDNDKYQTSYVYDDEEGISYPLTPFQLVYGRQISFTPSDRQFDIISTNQALTKRAKNQRRLYYSNSQSDGEMNIYEVFAKLRGYCMVQKDK